jgi:molybdenum cofactor synthesis domain-containing protein
MIIQWAQKTNSKSELISMNNPARQEIRIGIVTVSDRASRGEYQDRGGPAIREYLTEVLLSAWTSVPRVIADEQTLIESTLRELAAAGCCLIVTTGGTGPAARDVTPEATEAVCEKTPARVRRTDAKGLARKGADGDPVATDRRHPR